MVKWNTQIWYQASWQESSLQHKRIRKLRFRVLTRRQTEEGLNKLYVVLVKPLLPQFHTRVLAVDKLMDIISVKPLREHRRINVESMNTNWPRSHVYILLKIWLLSSYSSVEETGTSTFPRPNSCLFIYPRRIFFPKNMVTLVLGWLRMRKISGKATVPLDAVPNDAPRDFGPEVAFGVSQGSDTCRQAGRERNVGP